MTLLMSKCGYSQPFLLGKSNGLLQEINIHSFIQGPFWPRKALLGAPEVLGQPRGPDLGQAAIGWSNWVGRIHIMCLGPF